MNDSLREEEGLLVKQTDVKLLPCGKIQTLVLLQVELVPSGCEGAAVQRQHIGRLQRPDEITHLPLVVPPKLSVIWNVYLSASDSAVSGSTSEEISG